MYTLWLGFADRREAWEACISWQQWVVENLPRGKKALGVFLVREDGSSIRAELSLKGHFLLFSSQGHPEMH